jgi:hypothetical protein
MSEKKDQTDQNEKTQESAQEQDVPGQGERKQAAQAYADKARQEDSGPMPKVDMNTFILSLSSSVLVHLGEVPDPESGQSSQNLPMARHTIDILGMLEQKTKGNLEPDEDALLKNVLFELRMKYVQKAD